MHIRISGAERRILPSPCGFRPRSGPRLGGGEAYSRRPKRYASFAKFPPRRGGGECTTARPLILMRAGRSLRVAPRAIAVGVTKGRRPGGLSVSEEERRASFVQRVAGKLNRIFRDSFGSIGGHGTRQYRYRSSVSPDLIRVRPRASAVPILADMPSAAGTRGLAPFAPRVTKP
jgi:hypothetical protein